MVRVGRVAAKEPVLSEDPQIAGLRPRGPPRLLQCLVEVERLRPFALLAGLQGAQQIGDLVLAEAGQGQVDLGAGLEIGQKAG